MKEILSILKKMFLFLLLFFIPVGAIGSFCYLIYYKQPFMAIIVGIIIFLAVPGYLKLVDKFKEEINKKEEKK